MVWFIPRPVSAPNRWLWRGGWVVAAGFWIDALGAFGYDDRATSAVPGLYFVHSLVAPLVVLSGLMILIASGCAMAWTRLPRAAALGVMTVLSVGSLLLIATAIGLGP